MIEAGIQGITTTLGMEVEDMKLTNFKRIDDFVEEWGVETFSIGEASQIFDYSTGNYDIRITYFDEEKGHSTVKLFIEDKEKVSFKLDEDTDCWRWRLFKNININKGDKITLVAESDQGEKVRLDFVEYIRTTNKK